ncbi:Stk1 family PASTA domain-containing Ser/Thr kinase [Thermoflavimicrobium daqui]|nr:Stk1 family PASTA domain-containing Ser/Thr kinase [Thermoflavimicrobium daqui]
MEGKKLGGRYEVISRIGGGGMAVVYKARDILLNRFVAIKILSESLSNDSEFIRRFSREAQAAASLSHPNVVNVYDVGRDGYIHYIVMELVEGPTLKDYVLERGPLPVEEAARIAIQICDGLAHAHDNQIVHRDVKPHNILLHRNGQAKVTDFGIARAASSSTITQQGSVMGSVHYFSPEQARGGQIGEKSDIYSLGVVLYEMLTGELPFDGDSAVSIAIKHLQEEPLDPRQVNPNVPDHMATIILRAMHKDPNMRYTSVRAMMKDLEYALQMGTHQTRNVYTGRIEDAFQEIPLDDDSSTSFHQKNTQQSPIQRPGIRTNNSMNTRKGSHQKVGDQTRARLKILDVPADENKTILQKTMVYLQEELTWWQKLLFGLFTFFVIIFLAFYGFNKILTLFGGAKDSSQPADTGNTVSVSQTVKLPELKNMKKDQAIEKIKELGLEIDQVEKKSDEVKPNHVIRTKPEGGAEVKKGSTVTLYITPKGMKVDNYIGMYEQSSRRQLPRSGNGYKIKMHYCNGGKKGQVYQQHPSAGDYIQEGGTVEVWVGSGNHSCRKQPPKVSVNKISRFVASADSRFHKSADFIFYMLV